MGHFFWGDPENGKKIHLANWGLICQKTEFGGMGVQNLRDYNLCLLASWIKRYHLDTNKNWKMIVEAKYDLDPNIFWANPSHCSPFWKGVMWAAKSAKVGYSWKVGRGDKVLFWEDVWFGHCSLAIVFWDLYIIANEQHCTIASVWDGVNLKISFRRTVSQELYNRWLELVNLIASASFSEEEDSPVWMFHPSGVYSVKSFYAIVNNGGIVPVHTPAVWKLVVPPRIHIFLWLLANNKTLTRDNLNKRFPVEDRTCLFCSEFESVEHLFFKCIVADHLWQTISTLFGISIGSDFESVARWWISNNKNSVLNTVSSAVLWAIWSLRNDLCFQGRSWLGLDMAWSKVTACLGRWRVLFVDVRLEEVDQLILKMEQRRGDLLRIIWEPP
jgi:hypothetical protein